MFLSIIIPVFNSSKYLRKCLDSCLNQNISIDDYELLIIDDGSSDNSYDIAFAYSVRFQNIRLIKQKNCGASAARNRAIDLAKGDYIWFVDSDDFIEENILGAIYNTVRTQNIDLLFVDWQGCNSDGEFCDNTLHYRKCSSEVMTGNQYLKKCAGYLLLNVAYIIKRSFLISSNIRLKENACFEDTDFYFRLIPLAKRVSMCEKRIYYYVNHAISASSMKMVSEKKFQDLLDNLELAHNCFLENNEVSKYFEGFRDAIVLTALQMVATSKSKKLYNKLHTCICKCNITKLHTTQRKQKPIAKFFNIFGLKTTYQLAKLLYARNN